MSTRPKPPPLVGPAGAPAVPPRFIVDGLLSTAAVAVEAAMMVTRHGATFTKPGAKILRAASRRDRAGHLTLARGLVSLAAAYVADVGKAVETSSGLELATLASLAPARFGERAARAAEFAGEASELAAWMVRAVRFEDVLRAEGEPSLSALAESCAAAGVRLQR